MVSTDLAVFGKPRRCSSEEIFLSRQAVIESLVCAVCSGVLIVLLLYAVLCLLSPSCMQALTHFYPQSEQRSRTRGHKQASRGHFSAGPQQLASATGALPLIVTWPQFPASETGLFEIVL